MRRRRNARHPAGFTIIELLIVVAIIGIVAAIALPGLLQAKQSANEASAIGSLRTIHSAQAAFASTCGSGFFAPSLLELGKGPGGVVGVGAYISPDLSSAVTVTKSNYVLMMGGTAAPAAPQTCTLLAAGQAVTGYQATATPVAPADRHLAVNTSGTIYENRGPFGAVPEQGPPPVGSPIQ